MYRLRLRVFRQPVADDPVQKICKRRIRIGRMAGDSGLQGFFPGGQIDIGVFVLQGTFQKGILPEPLQLQVVRLCGKETVFPCCFASMGGIHIFSDAFVNYGVFFRKIVIVSVIRKIVAQHTVMHREFQQAVGILQKSAAGGFGQKLKGYRQFMVQADPHRKPGVFLTGHACFRDLKGALFHQTVVCQQREQGKQAIDIFLVVDAQQMEIFRLMLTRIAPEYGNQGSAVHGIFPLHPKELFKGFLPVFPHWKYAPDAHRLPVEIQGTQMVDSAGNAVESRSPAQKRQVKGGAVKGQYLGKPAADLIQPGENLRFFFRSFRKELMNLNTAFVLIAETDTVYHVFIWRQSGGFDIQNQKTIGDKLPCRCQNIPFIIIISKFCHNKTPINFLKIALNLIPIFFFF